MASLVKTPCRFHAFLRKLTQKAIYRGSFETFNFVLLQIVKNYFIILTFFDFLHFRDLVLMTTNAFVQPDFRENIVNDKPKHVQITLAKMVQLVLTTPTSWEEALSATSNTPATVLRASPA